MLIDTSYFFGDILIGQLSEQSVQDKVNWFINQYEPEILRGLLGYETYNKFMIGLAQGSIEAKWMDLLSGAEYTDQGILRKWDGLLQLPSGSTTINFSNEVNVVVGRGGTYDPEPGTTTTIPAGFVGKAFTFIQRGFGPLIRRDEDDPKATDNFSVSGNALTLLNGFVFTDEDTYFYYGDNSLVITGNDATTKISLIAYYVYYWYQRSQASTTSGTGEGKTQTQNAIPISAMDKMASAWNKMVNLNKDLYLFLHAKKDVYTEWYDWAVKADSNLQFFHPINTFNI